MVSNPTGRGNFRVGNFLDLTGHTHRYAYHITCNVHCKWHRKVSANNCGNDRRYAEDTQCALEGHGRRFIFFFLNEHDLRVILVNAVFNVKFPGWFGRSMTHKYAKIANIAENNQSNVRGVLSIFLENLERSADSFIAGCRKCLYKW